MGTAMMRVSRPFRPVVISLLPPDHRIVAERELGAGHCDMIISGPMLPEADEATIADATRIPLCNLVVKTNEAGEGTTYWAYWDHAPQLKWQVRNPWEKVALGCD
jgi:hypothetical protein